MFLPQALKPFVEKLVKAQQNLVAKLATDAERFLKERDADGVERKRAGELEEEAGLALLRAHRGFPRSRKMMKNWKHDWSRSGKQKWTWKGDNSPTVGARELLKESWNKR